MTSEALDSKDRLWSLLQFARLSSRLPGADVMGVRDGFWDCRHLALLHLVAKPSHAVCYCGWASLPPTLVYDLWVTGQGTESSDERYPILSPCESQSVFNLSF
jgi:hypothetical protein